MKATPFTKKKAVLNRFRFYKKTLDSIKFDFVFLQMAEMLQENDLSVQTYAASFIFALLQLKQKSNEDETEPV
jgi:hypothetical protein